MTETRDIPGELVARLIIMTAWRGSEDIEFFRRNGEGVVRYFKYANNREDQFERIYPLNQVDCGKLLSILKFPEPVMEGKKMMGLDGVTYELTLIRNGTEKTWSWWCDAPKGWEAVAKAADALMTAARVTHRISIMRSVMCC